jgi:hypothetical protein
VAVAIAGRAPAGAVGRLAAAIGEGDKERGLERVAEGLGFLPLGAPFCPNDRRG